MTMKTALLRFLCLLALIAGPAVTGSAEDVNAVRQRLAQRLPQIDEMKSRGVVGENNRGFLEAREGGADAALIAAENKDRETAYATLAEQTKTSPDQVGRARARQIAQSSRPGVWLQDVSGEWKKK